MAAKAIEVSDLHKSYGSHEAVRGVDLVVNEGDVFALLGPNGAGKTTTVEILEGHRHRTSGSVSVLGHDPGNGEPAYKQRIGIVLQETGVERYLTVAEAIDLYRGYYPNPLGVDEVIEIVGLTEKRNERIVKLSGGQQRRLDVAVGLAGDPDLLFLDEPTTGFDPSARRGAWEMIRNLKSLGKTVLLTTHYMDEAQALADRVAIIAAGKIIAEGPPDGLLQTTETVTTIRFVKPSSELPPTISYRTTDAGFCEISTSEPVAILNELTGWAMQNSVDLAGLSVARPTLEDVYLQLVRASEKGEES
jgi:ABC-2 type transport system ATP-binding protein